MERRRGTRALALVHVGTAAQQKSHESDTACLVIAVRREEQKAPTVFVYVVYVAWALGMQKMFTVEVAPHARDVAIFRVNLDKDR